MVRFCWFFQLVAVATVMVIQPAAAQTVPQDDEPGIYEDANIHSAPTEVTGDSIPEVTDIRLEPTSNGINLMLLSETPLQFRQFQDGNSLIVEIERARLAGEFADEGFRQDNPVAGMAGITVMQVETGIRVTLTGVDTAPNATVTPDPRGLVLSLTVADSSTAEALEPPAALPLQVPPPSENAIRIIVTGERETYRVSESAVGTRTDTDIRDVPQAIQVIPQQVLEDQGIQEIGDALQNASGVVQAERASTPLPGISAIIRGFETNNVLRNGLRDTNARFATVEDNIAQVEILKGPASVLFGQGNLGGTINLVTEVPLEEPTYQFEYSGGQFGFNRFAVDFSSPFELGSPLGFRANAAYEFADGFREFEHTELLFVAPTVQLIANDTTELLVDLEYLKFRSYGIAPELPASGTVLDNPNGDVDRTINLGEPDLVEGEDIITRVGYRFEHRFSEDWRLRNEFLLSHRESESVGVTPRSDNRTDVGLEPELQTVQRLLTINPGEQTSIALNTSVTGRFETWGIEHQVLAGVELLSDRAKDRIVFDTIDSINIFDPDYAPESRRPLTVFQDEVTQTVSVGLYLQDQITLLDNLILLLGGRFDIVNQSNQNLINEELNFEQEDRAFSPRVGIVYRPIEPISLYASYSESFLPVNGRETSEGADGQTLFGDPFEPERGRQYEVGIKADISDQISATLAFYDLERSNVRVQGSDNPLTQFQVGVQRSRGIEFDIAGEILPGWQVIAGYAYTDARVIEDDRIAVGNRLSNVPEHAASIWTSYEIQSGTLQGLGFGVGLFFQDEREVAPENLFTLPSYWRTDAALFYRRDQLQVSLNFRNLFDVEYYPAGRDYVRVIPGQPFTIIGKISWEF
jgi:iron complex outermembrane receptor protein